MISNSLEERRRYVNEIKASFSDPAKSSQYTDVSGEAQHPPGDAAAFFKLRLMIAAAIFAAFVYCDQKQVRIRTYSTDKICEFITQTVSPEQVVETFQSFTGEKKKSD